MKRQNRSSKFTQSVHVGTYGDKLFGGISNPIYVSTPYNYDDVVLYPRYFNTPNQKGVVEKIVALENGEDGLVFSSGMAAVMTSLFALLKPGDHIVFPIDLYGGTHSAALQTLAKWGMDFSFVNTLDLSNFERAITKKTRLIYLETPSNPILRITDLQAISKIARSHGIMTMIDNTFASPVNQNPLDFGIDLVIHSGTKYVGGHSDLSCGFAISSRHIIERLRTTAKHFGASLDSIACYLAERSLKTIVLRVQRQNANAMVIAEFLEAESKIKKVYYPGLPSHLGHEIAKKQMRGGFGGVLSFEIRNDTGNFISKFRLIKRAVSLGGIETTAAEPIKTSHKSLTAKELKEAGISRHLIRLSVGIEDPEELIQDLRLAL
jgi:cystathionine beta-lyase/cystathionine gamma-synthase